MIHAKTEGSPLFMADLARYLRANERSVQDPAAAGCSKGRSRRSGATARIDRGMIDRKIAQLTDEDRALLTAASVQGHVFDSAIVAQALGMIRYLSRSVWSCSNAFTGLSGSSRKASSLIAR